MKIWTVPLAKVSEKDLELPFTFYEMGSTKITLDLLTPAQIEDVFGFEYVEFKPGQKTLIEKTDRSSAEAAMMSHPFFTYTNPGIDSMLSLSRLQLSLHGEDEQEMNKVKESLDFALMCVLKRGIRFVGIQEDSSSGVSIQSFGSTFPLAGAYSEIEVNNQLLNDAMEVFNTFLNEGALHHKLTTIKALLSSAMNQPTSIDVSCALYFSVIESIYLQDERHTELTYKLCMRVTKKLNEDIVYRDKIKTLYGKRSNVIHGAEKGSVFNDEDHEYLRNLATSTVLAYIKNPEGFSVRALDTLLLSDSM